MASSERNTFDTAELTPASLASLSSNDVLQLYNGLDCCVTLEVFEALQTLFNAPPAAYAFERALQGPLLEMMLRGFRIDDVERRSHVVKLQEQRDRLYKVLDRLAHAVWNKPLNPRSPKQLLEFFYGALRLPEQWTSQRGVRKLSMNRETLEKLEFYFHVRPVVATILAIRDCSKKIEVLLTEVDPDGRMRTSYNPAGTETGRLSSSASAFGTGSNLQNITPELRRVFIPDSDRKLCTIDLEQAESREVGWLCGTLFNDWTYLNACEGGDLHTLTCKLIWPRLEWPGDPRGDRALADAPFYRQFSRRDMSKRGGHGSNYYGTPFTMARHLKVPVQLMVDFQAAYFSAFPAIPRWHRWTAEQIQRPPHALTTAFGRTRHFFGRPNDDATLREAIAYSPQSSTADRTNTGLYRIWRDLGRDLDLLAQTHDSVTFQYDARLESELIPAAMACLRVELRHGSRVFTVPGEAKVGWNWGNASAANPFGLAKWKGPGTDTRQAPTAMTRVLS